MITAMDIAKAVAAALAGATFSPAAPGTPTFAADFIPVFDLSKVSTAMKITAVPEAIDEVADDTRSDDIHVLAINIGIQRRLASAPNSPTEVAEIEALLRFVSQIVAFLSRRAIEVAGQTVRRREIRSIAMVDPVLLQQRVFTSVLRITYAASVEVGS